MRCGAVQSSSVRSGPSQVKSSPVKCSVRCLIHRHKSTARKANQSARMFASFPPSHVARAVVTVWEGKDGARGRARQRCAAMLTKS
ncbi:hypothetical protein Mapa_009965 [Marchantia paleacea]|nr:hypothetical protein Mapa_009965 [Marchantia paleacea]